jgi:hypothetical protein
VDLVELRLEADPLPGLEPVALAENGLAFHPGHTGHQEGLRTRGLDDHDLGGQARLAVAQQQ